MIDVKSFIHEVNNISVNMPAFYRLLLEKWLSITMLTDRPVRTHIIWNNCNFKIDFKKKNYKKKRFEKGIYLLHQIITPQGIL